MRTNVSNNELQTVQAPRRLFTIAEANAALVYVRPIVNDITTVYAQLMQWRDERDELMLTAPGGEGVEALREQIEHAVMQLNALYDELANVGCELKDWATGLVDFPAEQDGRYVWLCWRLGEDSVAHWHEWNSGMSGRQPVETLRA